MGNHKLITMLLALTMSGSAAAQKTLTLNQLQKRQAQQQLGAVPLTQEQAPATDGKQRVYASPELLGQEGPFPSNTDFYYLSAAQPVGVTFIAGNPSLLKQAGLANVYFDVSSVQFGKTNFFEDYRKVEDTSEVEDILSSATNYFLAQYNSKNKKGLRVVKAKETTDCPYAYVVRLRKLNKGNATGFWLSSSIKEGAAVIDGTVELVRVNTGEILCVFGFNNISGSDHVTKRIRIGLAFSELGNKLGKLVRDKY